MLKWSGSLIHSSVCKIDIIAANILFCDGAVNYLNHLAERAQTCSQYPG